MIIYFDERGRIKDFKKTSDVIATSKNVDIIDVYADFDASPYDVSITLKRADSVILGPYNMLPKTDVNGITYHSYSLNDTDTAVVGPLQISIRYEIYQFDDVIGEFLPTMVKAMALVSVYVNDAVKGGGDRFALITNKINNLEKMIKAGDAKTVVVNEYGEVISEYVDNFIIELTDQNGVENIAPMMLFNNQPTYETTLNDDGVLVPYEFTPVAEDNNKSLVDDGHIEPYDPTETTNETLVDDGTLKAYE